MLNLIEKSDGIPGILRISYQLLNQVFVSNQGVISKQDLDIWRDDIFNPGGQPASQNDDNADRLFILVRAFYEKYANSAEKALHLAVLQALAMISIPFRRGNIMDSPSDQDPLGFSHLAGTLYMKKMGIQDSVNERSKLHTGSGKIKGLEDVIIELLKSSIVIRVSDVPGKKNDTYYIAKPFDRYILDQTVNNERISVVDRLGFIEELSLFLGNILEQFPTRSFVKLPEKSSSRVRKTVDTLSAFYKLQTKDEQRLVSRWLWAMLTRHELLVRNVDQVVSSVSQKKNHIDVQLLRRVALRSSAHSVIVSISSFASKLFFWWNMFCDLSAYSQVLYEIKKACRASRGRMEFFHQQDEKSREKTGNFYSYLEEMIGCWEDIDDRYPKEKYWNVSPDINRCRLARQQIVRIQSIISQYYNLSEDDGVAELFFKQYKSFVDDQKDIRCLISYFIAEMDIHLGDYDSAIEKHKYAIANFSDVMKWANAYGYSDLAEATFKAGQHIASLERSLKSLYRAGGPVNPWDVEPKAWAWSFIGDQLFYHGKFLQGIVAHHLSVVYAFRQLPNPAYGEEFNHRVDDYNIDFYIQMCDRLVYSLRNLYAIDKGLCIECFKSIQEYWNQAITRLKSPYRQNESRPDFSSDIESLLLSFNQDEKQHLYVADLSNNSFNARQLYDKIMSNLGLPRVPQTDSAGYENFNEYYLNVSNVIWKRVTSGCEMIGCNRISLLNRSMINFLKNVIDEMKRDATP